jgi:hypothetical protein
VAVIAAFVAAFLATRRTKSETRWRAKFDAYARVLGAVEDMRFWAEETYASNLLLPTVGSDELKAATRRYDEAKRVLWSYVHVGVLVISDEAREKLDEMLSSIAREEIRFDMDAGNEDDYSADLANHCDNVRNLVATHLPGIVTTAKHDLG